MPASSRWRDGIQFPPFGKPLAENNLILDFLDDCGIQIIFRQTAEGVCRGVEFSGCESAFEQEKGWVSQEQELVVVNNSDEPQTTIVHRGDGKTVKITLKPRASKWNQTES